MKRYFFALVLSSFLVGCTGPSDPADTTTPAATGNVQEIRMTSFTEIIDGEYHPQYSEKEIRVQQGDTVRLYVTVTSGTHDIKIDEFDVFAETPLNEEVMVEFIADKKGSFEYYCTKPNHRKNGHWGTLIVE